MISRVLTLWYATCECDTHHTNPWWWRQGQFPKLWIPTPYRNGWLSEKVSLRTRCLSTMNTCRLKAVCIGGRHFDCSFIGLAFGMKLEELIMDSGRTTSIPVVHFRKEQAGGGHAAADSRWCMHYANVCVLWAAWREAVILLKGAGHFDLSQYCAIQYHSEGPSNVSCVEVWMAFTRVCHGVEDHHKKRTKGVVVAEVGFRSLFYSFYSFSFSLRIFCHPCHKIVWFVTYFTVFHVWNGV
jgi:hypothetical protein